MRVQRQILATISRGGLFSHILQSLIQYIRETGRRDALQTFIQEHPMRGQSSHLISRALSKMVLTYIRNRSFKNDSPLGLKSTPSTKLRNEHFQRSFFVAYHDFRSEHAPQWHGVSARKYFCDRLEVAAMPANALEYTTQTQVIPFDGGFVEPTGPTNKIVPVMLSISGSAAYLTYAILRRETVKREIALHSGLYPAQSKMASEAQALSEQLAFLDEQERL